jgi:hypothetical protein
MTRPREINETHERNQSLWLLIASPVIRAAHFLLCYITASIWCAKVVCPGGPLRTVRVAIAVYTALALAGIGIMGTRQCGSLRSKFANAPANALDALTIEKT